MVKEIICDIFEAPIDILVHGANIQCAMYSGIAGEIRKRFPEAIEADNATVKGDIKKLGTCSIARIKDPKSQIQYIYNAYCQKEPRTDIRACNYEATYRSLEWIKNHTANSKLVIGFPKLFQCGLAGGSWRVVREMIFDVFEDSPRKVIICERPPNEN